MAQEEEKLEPESPSAPLEIPQQQVKKPKALMKLALLGVVVSVVGCQCGVAYWLMNSYAVAAERAKSVPEAKSETKSAEKAEKGEKKSEKPEDKEEAKTAAESLPELDRDPEEEIEVVLGEFSVTTFQPATSTTMRIEFNLYGTVDVKNQKEFLAALEENQHRFRDQVLVIVRSAEITDLTDAGLGLVKRKIMEKTNRMIGKPYLRSIIFSDFSFIEQ
jgi:flagellar basal body-associated protein FliL